MNDAKEQMDEELFTDDLFIFENGLYGFEHLRRFVFVNKSKNPDNPFKLMVSLDNPEISFIVVPPFEVCSNYEIDIDDIELKKIGVSKLEHMVILCIVTLSKENISTNLRSPIILSLSTNKGKQIILEDDKYETKHMINIRNDVERCRKNACHN